MYFDFPNGYILMKMLSGSLVLGLAREWTLRYFSLGPFEMQPAEKKT